MNNNTKLRVVNSVSDIRLPRYQEIPAVGLYLEQTTKYIAQYLDPLEEGCLTASMIGNYVKKGLISSPVKKQYTRDQIAYLFFIALAKSVLSLDNLTIFIDLQKQTHSVEVAYDYFCCQFEQILKFVFGLQDTVESIEPDAPDEKIMLRNTIIAISHKLYLDKCFQAMNQEAPC